MKQHSVLWLIVLALLFLLAPLFVSHDRYQSVLQAETEAARRWYAPHQLTRIEALSGSLANAALRDTGIEPSLEHYFIKDGTPTAEIAPGVRIPEKWSSILDGFTGYWQGLLLNLHLFFFRLAHAMVWTLYLLPFLAAIVFDGIMRRRAKIESFKYTSPTRQSLSWHGMIAIWCFTFVYFASAVEMPIWYIPVVITLVGILFRVVIANVQHSA